MITLFGKDKWFYNESIRRYTTIFGGLFTELYIKRSDETADREDYIKVPIKFGRGFLYEKLNPSEDTREYKRVRQILPAMAFELTNIQYDKNRKLNRNQMLAATSTNPDDSKNWTYNPEPYIFEYSLFIRTKNSDDFFQIMEQIIPQFSTDVTLRISDLPPNSLMVDRDIVIQLVKEAQWQDTWADVTKDTRTIDIEMKFNLNGYLYSKVQKGPVIREIEIYGAVASQDIFVPVENLFSSTSLDETEEQTIRNAALATGVIQGDLFDSFNVDNIDEKSFSVIPELRKYQ